ncbi:rna-directed dna polymerase from mobile element jockey-like [Willisornis vidua]|uniref:Rna-directed dna polymerase from mobile element jockey-like n=1 Tax=Willisornis vidua TaxID=1566151 RepID=A0ABQ9DUZ9_9PASS|nr:rna-directed dna polymerase from mobile element jockey-like [Willisornis vidua]
MAWLNSEILKEIKLKRRAYRVLKKGLVTHEEFRDLVRSCRKKIRETKVQFEIILATSLRDNKKPFYKYINSKRRGKENLHSLVDSRGNIVNQEEEKAEVLNTYFASVFTSKTGGTQDNWPLELTENDRKLYNSPKFQEDTVNDLLKKHLDPQKSMEPDGIHPRVMRKLVEGACQATLHHLPTVLALWGGPR